MGSASACVKHGDGQLENGKDGCGNIDLASIKHGYLWARCRATTVPLARIRCTLLRTLGLEVILALRGLPPGAPVL